MTGQPFIIKMYSMKTFAFKMKLLPGKEEEYRKRHDAIWPELVQLLQETGVSEYHIYLDETSHTLFAFQKLHGEANSQQLGDHPVVQQWWAMMADICETNPDNSPVTLPLVKMFEL